MAPLLLRYETRRAGRQQLIQGHPEVCIPTRRSYPLQSAYRGLTRLQLPFMPSDTIDLLGYGGANSPAAMREADRGRLTTGPGSSPQREALT